MGAIPATLADADAFENHVRRAVSHATPFERLWWNAAGDAVIVRFFDARAQVKGEQSLRDHGLVPERIGLLLVKVEV